jgi:hypothetical protein
VAAEAPDSLIDSLLGHKTYKPKYGNQRWLFLVLPRHRLVQWFRSCERNQFDGSRAQAP